MREKTAALSVGYTICAYMRLSNEDRDVFGRKVESGSITSQRRLIMDFIDRQPEFAGCRVIERCDDGLSGRYFDTRPQFTDMINLAKQGKVDCIIVKDCSRFGRDYVELGDYLEQLFPFLGAFPSMTIMTATEMRAVWISLSRTLSMIFIPETCQRRSGRRGSVWPCRGSTRRGRRFTGTGRKRKISTSWSLTRRRPLLSGRFLI